MKKLFLKQTLMFLVGCFMVTAILKPLATFSQNDERIFFTVAYMKVKPDKFNDYVKMEKEVWKLVHKERVKQGKGSAWYMYYVTFPSGTQTEYDFVTVNAVKGWKSIETMWNGTYDIARKVLTKEQLAIFDKTAQFRDIVKEELWFFNDGVYKTPDSPPAKYQYVNFMKVPTGKWEDYINMEKQLAKPVHQEHVKAGSRAGWSLNTLRLPGGDNLPYHACTFDLYDKWEDMGVDNSAEIWKKIHPDKTFESMLMELNSLRSLVKKEVRVLVDYVQ